MSVESDGDRNVVAGGDVNIEVKMCPRLVSGECVCPKAGEGCPLERERALLVLFIIIIGVVLVLSLTGVLPRVTWADP